MKIVWISNAQPSKFENLEKSFSGGWLQEQYAALTNSKNNIDILSFFPGNTNYKNQNIINKYIIFKPVKNNFISINRTKCLFKKILNKYSPDLIHIHGTELPHCYAMSMAAIELKIPYVVSLQGIVSEIYKHVLTGLEPKDMFRKTFRDFFVRSSTIGLRNLYKRLSVLEQKVVLNSNMVIGRTNWDKAWITFNFENKKYSICNEPIRKEFLHAKKWEFSNCNRYQIFLAQSNTSIKGLHILLYALKHLTKFFPNIKLLIAGKNYQSHTFRNFILRTGYEKTIITLIKKLKIENNVKFLGPQNVNQMISNLLKSNVYVHPSVIENSPNSLMEAVFLNVPSVAANVGGISFLYNKFENVTLYQSDSSLMLANELKNILDKVTFGFNNYSESNNEVESTLYKIYNEVITY